MGLNKHRDLVVGPENGPEAPYPIRLTGPVIKGFGRGSKEVSNLFNTFEYIYFCLPSFNFPTRII
jgi:hypothetical protein